MKKNVLALSIATMIGGLGFSGAAMAQANFEVNESGTGAIQIVPYFTVQDGNATALHVVNTDTENAKAVKIRFRGASNSDDLLDFQVFLSPYDVWTGVVTADANGLLKLSTSDNSCTLPAEVRTEGAVAQLDRLTLNLWDTPAKKAAQTREGYVEILEMATIPPTGDKTAALFKAVKHNKGKAPCTPAAFEFLDSITKGGADEGLKGATNSLTASWYIMNVAASTTFSGSATALTVTNDPIDPVYAPQLAQTESSELASADPLFVGGEDALVVKQDFDVPDLSTPLVGGVTDAGKAATQAAELTLAINRKLVANQFYQDAGLSAATDWVFSMPTRRYLVAANYNVAPSSKDYIVWNGAAVAALGTETQFAAPKNVEPDKSTGQLCVKAKGQTIYDREEGSVKNGHVVSPGIAQALRLCGEVSVATFGAKSPVGAAIAVSPMKTDYSEGWAVVDFDAGVPALGSAFTAASNANAAAGMVGNYGITLPHFYFDK